jgi:predicted GIY-YIG superfamily endonuclease
LLHFSYIAPVASARGGQAIGYKILNKLAPVAQLDRASGFDKNHYGSCRTEPNVVLCGPKTKNKNKNMYFTYVLYNKENEKFYIGNTEKLEERVLRHKFVKLPHRNKNYDLVFYEAYISKSDARRRERYFKTTKGRTTLRIMLAETLKILNN